MVKNRHHYSPFELLSWTYLIVSAFLLGRFFTTFLGFNYENTFFLEVIYTFINWLFSLVVFSWIIIWTKKIKFDQFEPKKILNIQFSRTSLSAVTLWACLTMGCLFHATQVLFFEGLIVSFLLGTLLLIQFSISIYLLCFFALLLGIILMARQSKNIEIHISGAYDYSYCEPLNWKYYLQISTTNEHWQVYTCTLLNTFSYYKNMTRKQFFVFWIEFLKLKALKSQALRLVKKQTSPPNFLFIKK
ncbi:hypothetical protein JN01_0189 [Entomoplasma freundtii]|uniref:Uncharacterized protein n=1 Tax=Entomoplasma freundtii TaxID=74700 RepID=A0A2K8NRY7_9MOLU|nr:hypothetical protein [Entomoplasma freundtii]ATZ16600.1 hypothetical protein EFREU_v1c05790 [Entomoplasma freundtii]TDY58234.1 hypothetical protein JN01_0189 [Entomoplasma freundtii]